MYKTMLVILVASCSSSFAGETVNTCSLSKDRNSVVQVQRERPIRQTHVFSTRYGGKRSYFFDSPEASRGGSVTVQCVGAGERALVAYGEFSANYLQGFALVYDHTAHRIERFDFAEKGEPEWLYLSDKDAIVVIPTRGAGENGGKPYVAYRYLKGQAQDVSVEGIARPEPPHGYQIIDLRPKARVK